eukprot:4298156-Pyramimonas_sp.AAC.1
MKDILTGHTCKLATKLKLRIACESAISRFGRPRQGGGFPPTRDAVDVDSTGGFPGVPHPSPGSSLRFKSS